MVISEHYRTRRDGVELLRSYSDNGKMLQQDGTGVLYAEAIDPADAGRTYTETNIDVPDEEE